ncbi:MAG: thermosome subunit [Candidatus Lokiarchaeota archaeon]|nr:thermosome subunit [Candidatus Lokiarchaeota archaeon]MBD3200080.1 thermosome subunit [Candidatus Lokiarchaeota archaeon]
MSQFSGVPILILKEGTESKRDREARRQNIQAMMAITETVKSTMGPKGMDKMLVDSLGDVTITNDGAEILDKLDIENVAAIMMVNLAKSIDKEVGDGTTSAVVFTAKLLELALELIEQDIHPKPITHGFKLAADKALEIINEIAEPISSDDDKLLKGVARTAMNSKDIAAVKDYFAELALQAVRHISSKNEGSIYDKIENVKIVTAPGKSLKDSELINGIYIDKGKVSAMMPNLLQNAKIAVIRKKLDVVKGEYDANIEISSPDEIQKFLDQEKQFLKDYLEIFKRLGVNMIVNNQDISDKFGAMLGREGIAAIKNLSDKDIKAVSNAIDATMIDNLKDLTEEDLGFAEKVKFEKVGDDDYTLFSGCKNPKSVAILLKGGLDKILNTAEIALHDVISVIAKVIDTKKVVAGGGAINVELAKRLRTYASQMSGKEQLAVQAFASALEEIPKTLLRNAGLEEIEKMTELRAAHKTPEDKWMGVDTIQNKILNNLENGIIEPADLISHIIKSGSELANLILRVDRIINAKGSK